MSDLLSHSFSALCSQNLDHSWAPGGLLLPCCQRCTGRYVGALVALALHLWLKPRLSNRLLQLHGLCLLQMVPFGFHWLPQGPALRTVTGVLFAFGIVTFLWLVPAGHWQTTRISMRPHTARGYGIGLALCVVLIPILAAHGGITSGRLLPWLEFGGAITLGLLVLANVSLGLQSLITLCRRLKSHAAA
jgi:uncharacterized membrane protein